MPPEKRKRVSPETYRKHKWRFMLLMPLTVAILGATTLAIIEALLWILGGSGVAWVLLIGASLFWGFMAHAGFSYWRAFEQLEAASSASHDEQARIQRLVDRPRSQSETIQQVSHPQQQTDSA